MCQVSLVTVPRWVFAVPLRQFIEKPWGRHGFDSGFVRCGKHAGRVVRPVSQCHNAITGEVDYALAA